jgi:alpha-aminoadipic semialdehyde synthase
LGQRLLADGFSTPFLHAPLSYMQPSLADAKVQVQQVGKRIKQQGLPQGLGPLVFCFTGSGNVGQGAKHMFELLPHKLVKPEELKGLVEGNSKNNVGNGETQVYGCYLEPQHLARRKGGGHFNKQEYYASPDLYEACFHEDIAPYCSVLVNGMYWDHRFPRLLTTEQMANLTKPTAPGYVLTTTTTTTASCVRGVSKN